MDEAATAVTIAASMAGVPSNTQTGATAVSMGPHTKTCDRRELVNNSNKCGVNYLLSFVMAPSSNDSRASHGVPTVASVGDRVKGEGGRSSGRHLSACSCVAAKSSTPKIERRAPDMVHSDNRRRDFAIRMSAARVRSAPGGGRLEARSLHHSVARQNPGLTVPLFCVNQCV